MWSSIANLKENLNKIALDVHDDDDDDLSIYGGDRDSSYNDRRHSHSFAAHSNGVDSPYLSEIERYKAEIKKLRESENEIKALSVNYAALLKEKEEHISRLNQENGSLKQNLDETNAARNSFRKDSTTTNSVNGLRGNGEQSSSRQGKISRNRSNGNQFQNGVVPKQNGHSNGFVHGIQPDPASEYANIPEKELADMLEEKNRMLATVQNEQESKMRKLRTELEKEREQLADAKLKLQDEKKVSVSLKDELNTLKSNSSEASFEVKNLRKEVDEKASEIKRLQMELIHTASEGVSGTDGLKRVTSRLEKENRELKVEKEKLESALKEALRAVKQNPSSLDKSLDVSASFPGKDALEHSLHKAEQDLKETRRERDKALQQLGRLKQHLLDKELEDSEKMDEDGKIIEELRQHVEYQKATISNLERALQQARAGQDEVRMMNDHELQKSKEVIEDLKKKLASYMGTIDAKNTELMNLQTALGQYYAEIEAKEHLEGDLSLARDECSKLSQLLQDYKQQLEVSNKEKEDLLVKLAHADKLVVESKSRVNKIEEDNTKLRRAVEQSMTRLNRMSVDSDFLVDRRIVIKLLVTYFQKNHSREVLDLMVRMLGFSDEDKQRIGAAQQGTGKGVVRGVLGLPGRLVGGIMGGGSPGTPTNKASDDQSFADLWVDFLLKESEEREKRESMEASGGSTEGAGGGKSTIPTSTSHVPDRIIFTSGRPPIVSTTTPSVDTSRSLYSYQSTRQYDTGSAEFSTVPLTPSGKQLS